MKKLFWLIVVSFVGWFAVQLCRANWEPLVYYYKYLGM